MTDLSVTVLIPCRTWSDDLEASLNSCLRQSYPPQEIFLLADQPLGHHDLLETGLIRVLVSGPAFPGKKRNLGVRQSTGEVIACLDADAWADPDWIRKALSAFVDPQVGVIGGINLPPAELTPRELASWQIMASPLLSGSASQRYRASTVQERWEVQSSNMFIRRSALERFGGFREDILTAEDTDICFRLAGAGLKVILDPAIVVYHRPRSLYKPLAEQMFQYGLDQTRVLSQIPLRHRLPWFLPAMFMLVLTLSAILGLAGHPRPLFDLAFAYVSVSAFGSLVHHPLPLFFLRWSGTMVMHFAYSAGFCTGLCLRWKS